MARFGRFDVVGTIAESQSRPRSHRMGEIVRETGDSLATIDRSFLELNDAMDQYFLRTSCSRKLWCEESKPSRVLYVSVQQVDRPITEVVLREVFSNTGNVEKIVILSSFPTVQALVEYELSLSAIMAWDRFHGRNIYDRCCLMDVQFSSVDHIPFSSIPEPKAISGTTCSTSCQNSPESPIILVTIDQEMHPRAEEMLKQVLSINGPVEIFTLCQFPVVRLVVQFTDCFYASLAKVTMEVCNTYDNDCMLDVQFCFLEIVKPGANGADAPLVKIHTQNLQEYSVGGCNIQQDRLDEVDSSLQYENVMKKGEMSTSLEEQNQGIQVLDEKYDAGDQGASKMRSKPIATQMASIGDACAVGSLSVKLTLACEPALEKRGLATPCPANQDEVVCNPGSNLSSRVLPLVSSRTKTTCEGDTRKKLAKLEVGDYHGFQDSKNMVPGWPPDDLMFSYFEPEKSSWSHVAWVNVHQSGNMELMIAWGVCSDATAIWSDNSLDIMKLQRLNVGVLEGDTTTPYNLTKLLPRGLGTTYDYVVDCVTELDRIWGLKLGSFPIFSKFLFFITIALSSGSINYEMLDSFKKVDVWFRGPNPGGTCKNCSG